MGELPNELILKDVNFIEKKWGRARKSFTVVTPRVCGTELPQRAQGWSHYADIGVGRFFIPPLGSSLRLVV